MMLRNFWLRFLAVLAALVCQSNSAQAVNPQPNQTPNMQYAIFAAG
jgi:hypothetical protein